MGDIIPFPISSASHMHMKALITDICATVFTLELKADEAEQALMEILSNHKEILVKAGLTPEWLAENGEDDLRYVTPEWDENIRIHTWWACYSSYESDDQIVTAFIHDPKRTKTRYTGMILSPCGEYLIFLSDAEDPPSVWSDVYGRIQNGLTYFPDNTQQAFSTEWVRRHERDKSGFQAVSDGLFYAERTGDGPYKEFNLLRIYLFDNGLSNHRLHHAT